MYWLWARAGIANNLSHAARVGMLDCGWKIAKRYIRLRISVVLNGLRPKSKTFPEPTHKCDAYPRRQLTFSPGCCNWPAARLR